MSSEIKVIGRSIDTTEKEYSKELIEDAFLMSGKAAGICYMPDDYFDNGIKDRNKSLIRSKFNASNGHYSVFDHFHINFMIKTPKMIAMILNSMNLYSTSEKSARYTVMKPETKLEENVYNKWRDIFFKRIEGIYGYKLKNSEIEKLALENARYMISVWTPTIMEYTLPFSRVILLSQWLDDFANDIYYGLNTNKIKIDSIVNNKVFYERLINEVKEFNSKLLKELNIKELPFIDHKNMNIEFFDDINYIHKCRTFNEEFDRDINYIYGDTYVSGYKVSLSGLANLERHRTLHYRFRFNNDNSIYIPKIIRNTQYEQLWISDYNGLLKYNVMPQGTLVDVIETGRYEDFILKAKERLCARAQLEVSNIVASQCLEFSKSDSLNSYNKYIAKSIINEDNMCKYRCNMKDFTCIEGCKLKTKNINNRII